MDNERFYIVDRKISTTIKIIANGFTVTTGYATHFAKDYNAIIKLLEKSLKEDELEE